MLALAAADVLPLALTTVGLTVAISGVIAVVFTQFRKNTSDYLRTENADLRDRVATLEKERDELRVRVAAVEGALQVVSGATAVAELRAAVASYHGELSTRLDNLFDRRNDDMPVEHDRRQRD